MILTDEQCIAIYDEVSRTNITRDVKTPEKKIAAVRRGLGMQHGAEGSLEKASRASFIPCDCGCGRSCCSACGDDKGFLPEARYFASGPQGSFFCDNLELAGVLVDAIDKDDDWTITDLENPHGNTADGS